MLPNWPQKATVKYVTSRPGARPRPSGAVYLWRSTMSTTSDKVFDVTPEGDEPTLKRVLGPKLLLLFIVGDILGAGVYAVTGTMAGTVGGIVWLPFLLAFVVATLTAFSYLELVTQYPQAAGAAL